MKLLLLTAGLLLASIAQLGAQDQSQLIAPNSGMAAPRLAVASQTTSAMLARQPGRFTENRGQWNPEARFMMQRNGINIWITDKGAVYDLYNADHAPNKESSPIMGLQIGRLSNNSLEEVMRVQGHVLRLEFLGTLPNAQAEGKENLGTRTNYFLGQDRSKWGSDCQSFNGVRLQNLYAGIEAHFYLDDELPRYDLIVAPGGDPSQIRYRLAGAEQVTVTSEGRLSICTSLGEVELRELFAYQQEPNGVRRQVECQFTIDSNGEVGFAVGQYDRHRTLVIDPLLYSTFLGGSASEQGSTSAFTAIALANNGDVWVAGATLSGTGSYPTTTGAYDTTFGGGCDVVVAKIDTSASGAAQLAYSTFIGGSQGDFANDLVLDGSGGVWLTGAARAPYPTTSGDYDASQDAHEVFVTRLNPLVSGSAQLDYSILMGGDGYDEGRAIALDDDENVWITGATTNAAPNYPTTTGAYDESINGSGDAFVTKIDPSASGTAQLAYSTFIGGTDNDGGYDLVVDDGNIWITGYTNDAGTDYPTTTGAYDVSHNGSYDVFVTKLDPSASGAAQLAYSTFLGGSAIEFAYSLAVDASDNVWIAGYTAAAGSPGYPTTTGAYDVSYNGGTGDVVLTKIDPSASGASQLVYSTFIGGSGLDVGTALSVDIYGKAWITGYAQSGYPTTGDAYDGVHNGSYDAFLTGVNPSASGSAQLTYSTVIGGTGDDFGYGLALDGRGGFWLSGLTSSSGYPVISGDYDATYNGGAYDIFISKLGVCNAGGILDIALSPKIIWSPNDAMRTINAVLTILQGCGATATLQSITADETITGDVTNATTGTTDVQFDLRAERDRGGDGRIYTITYRLTDGVLTEDYTAKIVVPYNQGTVKVGGTSSCGTVALGTIPTFTGSTTSIPYKLGGSSGTVTLRIINTRGREVARLINGATQSSGDHTAKFTGVKSIGSYPGGDLPNGLYLVVLEGCGYSDVGMMEIAVP